MEPIAALARRRISISTNPFDPDDPYLDHHPTRRGRSARQPCGGAVLLG
jgi:hypothetical protein